MNGEVKAQNVSISCLVAVIYFTNSSAAFILHSLITNHVPEIMLSKGYGDAYTWVFFSEAYDLAEVNTWL